MEEREKALSDALLPVADKVAQMEKRMEEAKEAEATALLRLGELEKREEETLRLLRGQVAMLHGLAMGANLPKFRKDAIDREYLSLSVHGDTEGGGEA